MVELYNNLLKMNKHLLTIFNNENKIYLFKNNLCKYCQLYYFKNNSYY